MALRAAEQNFDLTLIRQCIKQKVPYKGSMVERLAIGRFISASSDIAITPNLQREITAIELVLAIENFNPNDYVLGSATATLLLDAVKKHNNLVIDRLLCMCVDVNKGDTEGNTPLSAALDQYFTLLSFSSLYPKRVYELICKLICAGADISCVMQYKSCKGFKRLIHCLAINFPAVLAFITPQIPGLDKCESGFHKGLYTKKADKRELTSNLKLIV